MKLMSYEEYENYLNKYNVVPVYKEIRADLDTPISIFQKVNGDFLLESVEGGDSVGRYSFITVGKIFEFILIESQIEIKKFEDNKFLSVDSYSIDNPLDKIKEFFSKYTAPVIENLPPIFSGAIGYLGYETVSYFEKIKSNADMEFLPDGQLVTPDIVLVYDNVKNSLFIVVTTIKDEKHSKEKFSKAIKKIEIIENKIKESLETKKIKNREKVKNEISSNFKKQDFYDAVEKCKQHIYNGDIIQVVISQKFKMNTNVDPFDLYRILRVENPSPYLYFLDYGDFQIIGSSPEVMVKVNNNELLLRPIAGTRKRGDSIERDLELENELINDEKERAEHLMLVDLGRNDLGRVSVAGSVDVADYMKIDKYSHVMHIVSTVISKLDEKFDAFDVIRAVFPAGTLTGAPKVRAMQIISEIENEKRGPYGGMIVNLGFNGNLDSCITIRTIVLKNGVATVQAGAGIVADSVAELEFKETENKARALINTIKIANKNGE